MDNLDLSVVYEGAMDKEILALCDALNCIPGVRTIDSCFGHGKFPPYVYLRCASLGSLNLLCEATAPFVSNALDSLWYFRVDNTHINEDTNYIKLVLTSSSTVSYQACNIIANTIRDFLRIGRI